MLQMYPHTKNASISFKQANVNIMAFSDTHGDLKNIAPLYQNFRDNQNDIFEKKDEKSTLNLMTIVGDWFMNPMQKGYLSNKDKTSGDYQALFLKSFIANTKALIPRLKVLYTPGNHCLDGGDKVLLEHIKNTDMDTIISNADLKEASLLKDLTPKQRKKIKEYKILEVEDDKNPELKHKVLAIGILPINIDYLVKEDIKGLNLKGTKSCKEADLKEEDTNETAAAISKITDKFKKENPDSAILLMSHSGEPVAEALAKKVGNIDLILNAHDHLDKVSYIYNQHGPITKIVSLSENGQKLESIKLHFEDNGHLIIKTHPYYTDFNNYQDSNPIQKLHENIFKKDLIPLFKVIDPLGRKSISVGDVRYDNNDIANFCTDAIYSKIKETYPNTQAFIIPSTAFRESLPTSKTSKLNNIDIMNLFKGITGDLSNVMVGEIKGQILANFICDNIIENLSSPLRNAINQSSGIIIDKVGIQKTIEKEKSTYTNDTSKMLKFIKIKNENGEFEPINTQKNYTIALPKKLFIKSNNDDFKAAGKSFVDTETRVYDYFKNFINDSNGEVLLPIDKRILT